MQSLANEVYSAIQSSRITDVKDCMEELVSVLQSDEELLAEVEKRLDKKDILWFNRNNNAIFFEIPKDNTYLQSTKKLDMDEEVSWFLSEIKSSQKINWENVKYRYQRALKFLGTKDVIYYNKIRKIVLVQYEDKWRYLNE